MTEKEYKSTALGDEIYYVDKDKLGFCNPIVAKVNKKKDDMICFTYNKRDYACDYRDVSKDPAVIKGLKVLRRN